MIARRVLPAALLTALALCSGCRVGDPLVDRLAPKQGGAIKPASCEMPPPCERPPTLELESSEPKALRWQGCPIKCEGTSSEAPTGSADSATGSTLALGCVPLDPLHDLATSLSCVTKRFTASATAPALSAGAGVSVSDVRWKSSNIVIEADDPLEIVISDAELLDTRIDLVGPITLRFQDATSLSGVSISSASDDARVVLDRLDPFDLIVGDSAQPFAGHLESRHSSWMRASVVAESVELDSVMIAEAFISARELISNDGALSAVTLDVGNATFAPAMLEGVAIAKCATLSFFGSKLQSVLVPRCSGEPTRIYDTDVVSGQIDGRISGDSSKLESVLLGVSEPSELDLWGVKVSKSTFCDHVESVKVSYNAVTCSACSEAAFDPPEKGCLLPLGDFEDLASAEADANGEVLRSNFCGALDLFEPCPPPLPMRTRPIGKLD